MKEETFLSAGIDIGTTTTHLIISKIGITLSGGFGDVMRAVISSKEIIYESPVYFTPLCPDGSINIDGVTGIINGEYERAGVSRQSLESGAVIITGESSKAQNARKVIEKVSANAGSFIAAQAGSRLESYLAGKGAGADCFSEETGLICANVDIGGGTTNISLFKNGECVGDCCLNVGGRLLKLDGDLITVSPRIAPFIKKSGIKICKTLSETGIESIESLCRVMADVIKTALGFANSGELFKLCCENFSIGENAAPDAVMFSGGVSECIGKNYGDFEFGDIGVILSREIQKSFKDYPCKILQTSSSPIRATVIGAGNFSTEISGSTINYNAFPFPVKNLPCVKSPDEISNFPCALCVAGEKSPSYDYIQLLAKRIFENSKGLVEKNIPVVVITEFDFSKALGQCLRRLLPEDYPFLCADGISCKAGDYIDVGAPVADGAAVRIVVKTLVFGGSE